MPAQRTNFIKYMLNIGLAALIGSLATILVGAMTYWNKDRKLDIKMIEISLTILSGENTDKSIYARRFAVNALKKYSGVKIESEDVSSWINDGVVPRGDFFSFSSPPTPTVHEFIRDFTPHDHALALARLLYFEASNRDEKIAVANIVMNRKNDENFPETIAGVIYQTHQFSMVGRPNDFHWQRFHGITLQ